jgi:hypothetical protein
MGNGVLLLSGPGDEDMAKHRLEHQAQRDTLWVGKGAGPIWLLLVAAIVVVATLAAFATS